MKKKHKKSKKVNKKQKSRQYLINSILTILAFLILFTVLKFILISPEPVNNIVFLNANHSAVRHPTANSTLDLISFDVFNNNSFIVNCDVFLEIGNGTDAIKNTNSFLIYPFKTQPSFFEFNMLNGDSSLRIYSECVRIS